MWCDSIRHFYYDHVGCKEPRERVAHQLNQTTNGMCLLTDFLIEKGIVIPKEFRAYVTARLTPPAPAQP